MIHACTAVHVCSWKIQYVEVIIGSEFLSHAWNLLSKVCQTYTLNKCRFSHFFLSEKDYPPVARAGNDVVIVLPVDHVTLYGNGSTDDKVDRLN